MDASRYGLLGVGDLVEWHRLPAAAVAARTLGQACMERLRS